MTTITLPTLTEQIRCTTYMQHPVTGSIVAAAEDGRFFMLLQGHPIRWLEVQSGIPTPWMDLCVERGVFIKRPFKIKHARFKEYTFSGERG